MTSMLRGYAVRKEGLTTFTKPESVSYYDTDRNSRVLFPFTYSNGILDISYENNTFKSQMVDTLNVSPSGEIATIVRMMGGLQLVSSLGDHFKEYIRAWRDGSIDAESPITLHIAPQVFRVQEADNQNITAVDSSPVKISTVVPSGDTYTTGSELNHYRSTYLFKTPMTITIVESGIVQYITFRSVLDQE